MVFAWNTLWHKSFFIQKQVTAGHTFWILCNIRSNLRFTLVFSNFLIFFNQIQIFSSIIKGVHLPDFITWLQCFLGILLFIYFYFDRFFHLQCISSVIFFFWKQIHQQHQSMTSALVISTSPVRCLRIRWFTSAFYFPPSTVMTPTWFWSARCHGVNPALCVSSTAVYSNETMQDKERRLGGDKRCCGENWSMELVKYGAATKSLLNTWKPISLMNISGARLRTSTEWRSACMYLNGVCAPAWNRRENRHFFLTVKWNTTPLSWIAPHHQALR